jgi:hypothetical protein
MSDITDRGRTPPRIIALIATVGILSALVVLGVRSPVPCTPTDPGASMKSACIRA